MKWIPEECNCGDVVRIKIGSIYHYGVYVSDDEVIQFGLPPIAGLRTSGDDIKVCSTTIEEFSCGLMVEVGKKERADKKKANKPSVVVDKARSRLGEGGYNLLHNNCEHFVNECLFNKSFCSQEEEARKKWRSRDHINVYMAIADGGQDCSDIYPDERRREIERITNPSSRAEKIAVWKLLSVALKSAYNLTLQDINPHKSQKKWKADGINFSLSHSNGVCIVALSNKPVGVDVETTAEFAKKLEVVGEEKFIKKITAKGESERTPIEAWTRKESLFKLSGKGHFVPSRISSDGEAKTYTGDIAGRGYCLSIATKLKGEPNIIVKELDK